jgi:hypothetical protein
MKAMSTLAAVVAFLAFTAAAFANPAMMKKHEGYPGDDGKGTTAVGEAAALKGAEDAPKTLKEQNMSSSGGQDDTLKRGDARALPTPTGPGYVGKGVTEGHIKDATKASPNPQ